MSGILEIIFQGFLEWAYTLILEIWEFFSTALLNIMSMDFAYLQSRIPILPVLQQSFLAVGWALLIGNLVFQSVRSMLSGLGFDAEDPKLLFSRTFVFSFLLVASPQICDIALNMTAVVIRMMEMPNAVAITTLSESAFAGLGTAWLLVIICGVVVMYQSIKLFVEMAERYFILCMLTITSPMAFGLGGSRSTSDIFSHWCRMYGSMCLLMVMNVVFIKILMSVLAYSPTGPDVLPWMVLVMAVVRTAKKFDSIISRLGLNPAITNEPRVPGMLSLMVARTMMSNAAKVISQNGAQGAGRSGGSGPPPGGAGNGHGNGVGNRNDRRDFNGNRNADKGGQRNPGEERDRRGRNRNGGSPTPDGAPSSGGKGSSNPGAPDAKRGSGGGQNRDAASSGTKKKGGGQREADGDGKGHRRNSGESGGAQRNRSYRNPNAPPDSPPESGRDASRSSHQDSGRQSSSGKFDGRRSSSQTSFPRNGEDVSANGGGQFPREQGFTESGRRDTGKPSAPRNGQPSPVRSETRAPVSRTATDNPAELAPSGAAPKKGGSDRGRSADGQSGRYSERPQEKSSRQTSGGAPPPSSSQTRTDGVSHSGVTENRAERTSVTDSRFTQRGESASQVKAKDGAVTPQSDAAHAPPHTPPETPPRNVTSPVTQEKASPDRETASGSGETRFSNRSAFSSTTTTTASSTANKSGAESRKVPPPDEKPGFSSADTRFTNRPASPTANAADSAQSYATEGRTDSPAPRNVTGSAPQGTVTLDKDKETASGSEDTRFTNRAASGDAASASQKAAPVSQMSASASGAASNGVAHSDKKGTGASSGETRFTNRTASPSAVSASQTSATASGAAPKSADSSDKKETASNSGETRFSNRTASKDAASVSQTSAAASGATSKSVVSSDRKDASAHSEDTRFTSRSASSNALPASAGASGATATSGVPSDKKETASNPGDARFSNRAAPGNATVTSQTSAVTNSAPSDKETTSNSEDTRFTNRSAPGSATSGVTSKSGAPSDKETTSNAEETRFSNRATAQTPMTTSGVTSMSVASSDKEATSHSEETRFSSRAASQTPVAASGVTSMSGAISGKETTSNAEETRFSNRTASQMSTATNGSVSSNKKETGSNSGDTRFSNRAASSSQTTAANNGVHTDKKTTSNSEETRFSNRAASQMSVSASGAASKSVIPADKQETGSNSGESRFTNRPIPSDTVSAPPAPANGVNAQGGSSKSNMETDSASGETRFTSRPTSGNAVPAPPASATVSAASSNRTEAARHSGDSRFTNRAASGDATSPPQTSATTGGGTSKGVPSSDKHAPSDSGETRFSNRPAPSDNASAPPAPTAASGATAKAIPSPDRKADSASEETRFTSRSVSGNAVSATPTPTTTGGGTSKIVPSPDRETASDSGDSRFTSRPASAVLTAPPPAVSGSSGSTDSSTVKETNSDSGGTRFTSRPASPVAASRSPVAADGGTSPDRFSAASNRTPEHTGATENRAAVVKPDNAGNSDAQVVISQTGAPPSHVVSSGKADGGVTTESRFSQRDSAKMAGQSHTAAPKADNSRGGVTDGASAHDTGQSARETRERVPAVTPSDSGKSTSARPERGETSGQSIVTTATPGHASSTVPRPSMSGGGSEQNATRRSARESAGQNNGRPENGASETSTVKAETTLSHPATVPTRVGGGDRETPTRPDRPGTEKRSATVSETPAPRQQASRSGADASGKTVNSDERRGSAKQPGESASPVSQRPSTFNNNAAPPRPVTRETAAGYGETQRQPRRNADVTPSDASRQRENPTRRGEQLPRKMRASGNGVSTRPNAERTERRADQPTERPSTNGQKVYPLNREQRTSQTARTPDSNSAPVRPGAGTANRADSERQRTQDNSGQRPVSSDTAAGQRPGRSNQTRTPPGMYAPDNGAPARPGRGMTERNDARRPVEQPPQTDNAAPRPDGRRPLQQQGERRAPDTRGAEGHDRVPILNGAAGKRDFVTRPNPERGKSAVPPPGRHYDAEWRSVPAGRENGTPQTSLHNGKETPRGGVTENGRPKTPSASKEDKRPLFDFFGFGGKRQ